MVGILIIIFLMMAVYRRSHKGIAYVRTGMGGQKVSIDRGMLSLPFFHKIVPVNLQSITLKVKCEDENALRTSDHLKTNIEVEFFIHVHPEEGAISDAARTLGKHTHEADLLAARLESKLISALRNTASILSLDELHQQRNTFCENVAAASNQVLIHNGLQLESVSVTKIQQTDIKHYNEGNSLDANGLANLANIIEGKRQERIQHKLKSELVEQNRIAELERERIYIERDKERDILDKQLEIEQTKVKNDATLIEERARKFKESGERKLQYEQQMKEAELLSQQELEQRRLEQERIIKETEIRTEKQLEEEKLYREQLLDEKRNQATPTPVDEDSTCPKEEFPQSIEGKDTLSATELLAEHPRTDEAHHQESSSNDNDDTANQYIRGKKKSRKKRSTPQTPDYTRKKTQDGTPKSYDFRNEDAKEWIDISLLLLRFYRPQRIQSCHLLPWIDPSLKTDFQKFKSSYYQWRAAQDCPTNCHYF